METTQLICLLAGIIVILLIVLIILLFVLLNNNRQKIEENVDKQLDAFRIESNNNMANYFQTMSAGFNDNQQQTMMNMQQQLQDLKVTINQNQLMEEAKLDALRSSMNANLTSLQNENARALEQMRLTVDDKLQQTLDTKLTQSFQLVNQQLEKVHEGLGEMQTLAGSVGDLKKVLSNVKTRGIVGEIQLGNILKEILAPNQYEENVATIPGSSQRVEYAIKLPASDDGFIYLPVDSKFPLDSYEKVQNALFAGDKEKLAQARKELKTRLRNEAKDIHDKYVAVPYTTEFAIMFLPTESLYAEACNLGLLDELQRNYKVSLAGPGNMAALLNSLQMGFKTLAIQQRSSEVWQLLSSVKNEFEKFAAVLEKTQQHLQQTSDDLDNLVGVRTRAINRKLSSIQTNTYITENIQEDQ